MLYHLRKLFSPDSRVTVTHPNSGRSRLLAVHLPGKWRGRTLQSGCGSMVINWCSVSYPDFSMYHAIFLGYILISISLPTFLPPCPVPPRVVLSVFLRRVEMQTYVVCVPLLQYYSSSPLNLGNAEISRRFWSSCKASSWYCLLYTSPSPRD